MAETARRMSSGLGTDVARRLIARPIHRQAVQTTQAVAAPRAPEIQPAGDIDMAALTSRLETEIRLMKAVVAAERHENTHLRACIGFDEENLGPEARAVRDRWAGVVDRLLQAGL